MFYMIPTYSMWYRNSIEYIPTKLYNEIKDKEYTELVNLYWDKDDYFHIGDTWKLSQLYWLWKYCEHDVSEFVSPLFSKFDAWWWDWECLLFCKEWFAQIIQHYADKVVWMYWKLIETWTLENYRKHATDSMHERTNSLPYELEQWEQVSTSRRYEYSIFEMVRLYKTFDYENNTLIYYWW